MIFFSSKDRVFKLSRKIARLALSSASIFSRMDMSPTSMGLFFLRRSLDLFAAIFKIHDLNLLLSFSLFLDR